MADFKGKVLLVTGGGTGIGRAAALAFARRGAHGIVVAGRRIEEIEAIAAAVEALGTTALAIPTDVSDETQVQQLIARAIEHFGRLDVAFNNAGIEGAFAPITELTAGQFDETIGINLRGVWLCAKYEIAAMLRARHGGAIVNTSSWLAHGAFPGSSIYSASKAALDGMIRALAQEVATDGIRVNNVNPGIIDTPMLRRFGDDEVMRPFIEHTPTRRLGTPEDVAEVVAWLCSDGARFVTGQNILVDGGYAIPGHRAWTGGAVSSNGREAATNASSEQ
jgi:NAD(P)-dependent dehydrogenase (short-subunit alcohol dehydrogenase family)